MVLLAGVVLISAAFLLLLVRLCRTSPPGGLNLPPGSLGWPYIGETLQLYSQNPNLFFASKQSRAFSTLIECPNP